MRTPWLVIDVNYLCARAFHSMGHLSYGEDLTGVLFGFFRDLIYLQDLHNTNRVVFCFDKGKSKRCEIYPEYKANRRQNDTEEQEMRRQIDLLRLEHLPKLGFKNVLSQKGFEADDLIASITQNITDHEIAIIVSADSDLYQLLKHNVLIWCPRSKSMWTEQRFQLEYRILPQQWPGIKALAGDATDNIRGVQGIGIKTAIKYANGQAKGKALQKIEQGILNGIPERNLPVVKLPFPGTMIWEPEQDEPNPKHWKRLTKELGMESLASEPLFRAR